MNTTMSDDTLLSLKRHLAGMHLNLAAARGALADDRLLSVGKFGHREVTWHECIAVAKPLLKGANEHIREIRKALGAANLSPWDNKEATEIGALTVVLPWVIDWVISWAVDCANPETIMFGETSVALNHACLLSQTILQLAQRDFGVRSADIETPVAEAPPAPKLKPSRNNERA